MFPGVKLVEKLKVKKMTLLNPLVLCFLNVSGDAGGSEDQQQDHYELYVGGLQR